MVMWLSCQISLKAGRAQSFAACFLAGAWPNLLNNPVHFKVFGDVKGAQIMPITEKGNEEGGRALVDRTESEILQG